MSVYNQALYINSPYPQTHPGRLEADPIKKLDNAREMLRVIAFGRPQPDAPEAAVAARASELLEYIDRALLHDDLADVYEPVHLHQFLAHAALHDLQYVGEANLADSQTRNLAPEVVAELREAQFARTRRFRHTLLTHAGPVREWRGMRASGRGRARSRVTRRRAAILA